MTPPPTHGLFEWKWHHFHKVAEEANFMAILNVFNKHQGEAWGSARDQVNQEVDALNLGIGLGQRQTEPYADIFRDRVDVWRFTGTLCEPGLANDEVRLTNLGQELVDGRIAFDVAMAHQASRLRFPRVRVHRENGLDAAIDSLKDALAIGTGVRVVEAWALAVAHLRELGAQPAISGKEAAQFLSGSASLDQIARRAEAIIAARAAQPTPDFPEPSPEESRRGLELAKWLVEYAALVPLADAPQFVGNPAADFLFDRGSADEIREWQAWWGSTP